MLLSSHFWRESIYYRCLQPCEWKKPLAKKTASSSQRMEAGDAKTFRLTVTDKKNGMRYLIDTEADISIFRYIYQRKQPKINIH